MGAVKEALALAEAIRPLLAGRAPEVQSAALADLLSIWLAGHVVPGDPDKTAELRAEQLEAHLQLVGDLLPVNFMALIAPKLRRMRGKK